MINRRTLITLLTAVELTKLIPAPVVVQKSTPATKGYIIHRDGEFYHEIVIGGHTDRMPALRQAKAPSSVFVSGIQAPGTGIKITKFIDGKRHQHSIKTS
jgi:hypothetical protein